MNSITEEINTSLENEKIPDFDNFAPFDFVKTVPQHHSDSRCFPLR